VIRGAKTKLEQASHKFAERIYQESASQQGGQEGPNQGGQAGGASSQGGQQEKVYDADYEVVDDDNKKK